MQGFFLTIFPQYTEGQPNFGNARILGTFGPPIQALLNPQCYISPPVP